MREVIHEKTDSEPWLTWKDELGIHYMYKCSVCGKTTTNMREDLFQKRLCYNCYELTKNERKS